MFYKVIRNQKVIDVLDQLVYVKYQLKHKTLLLCDESEAEGILSSDKNSAYHLRTLKKFPVDIYSAVQIEEIDKYEYDHLKILHVMTPEEIMDTVTMDLLERGLL